MLNLDAGGATGLHRAPWMAGIAQLVERQVVVLDVTGSSPVARPIRFRGWGIRRRRETLSPSSAACVGNFDRNWRCTAMTSDNIAAVILAGGMARRMGGGDKALLDLAGKCIVERCSRRQPAALSGSRSGR